MSRPSAAFVVPHPYVDALACFREPITALADAGWAVDLFTTLSPMHPTPFFGRDNVRLVPIEMTKAGAVRMVAALAGRRPRYDWLFAVPQWSLHYAGIAASLARIPMACISDELKAECEAATAGERRWKARERRAHQRCAFTIALSDERAAFIREENELGASHPIVTVPNAPRGPARRLPSRFYQDTLAIPCDQRVLLHAGSWWWKLRFNAVEEAARRWIDRTVLVFQGRALNHFAPSDGHHNLRFSPTVLPADLLDYAVSSAHIGLALYDSKIINDRLMGTASGKVALYMKNALPVIVVAAGSFDWVERERCGVVVRDVSDIGAAAERILSDYDGYVANVQRHYSAELDFDRHFAGVRERMKVA